jgi:peptidoglycan/LPS O-acetylase OafA/YrhL
METETQENQDFFARYPRAGGLIVMLIGAGLLAMNVHSLRSRGQFGMKSILLAPLCLFLGLTFLIFGKEPKFVHILSGAGGLGAGIYLLAGLKGSVTLPEWFYGALLGE